MTDVPRPDLDAGRGEVAPISRIAWAQTHRVIMSRFPPIDLFDDISDPRDWELLATAEAKTNPRTFEEIGNLGLIPPERRIAGPGASWVLASFTHVSNDRPSRFSDGSYGVYYAGDSLDTALAEHSFHMGRFFARTAEPAGWRSEVRQLIGSIDAELMDIRGEEEGFAALLDPDPAAYAVSQAFAAKARGDGINGLVYPSVRNPGGTCIAAFWPDVVRPPVQGDHFRYHWNGMRVDMAQRISGDRVIFAIPEP